MRPTGGRPTLGTWPPRPATRGPPTASRSPIRSSATGRAIWSGCLAGSPISRRPGTSRLARFFERLASFSRLILFDKRGTGLSDRVPDPSSRPWRRGWTMSGRCAMPSDPSGPRCSASRKGAACASLFAATYPARTTAIILFGGYARRQVAPDYPWGGSAEAQRRSWRRSNGTGAVRSVSSSARRAGAAMLGSATNWARYIRMGASPASRPRADPDERGDRRPPGPAAVRVPTLVLHRTGDRAIPVGAGRYLAEHIPGATFVELAGDDHLPWIGDADAVARRDRAVPDRGTTQPERDRVLATVLFTDIVGSTERLRELGDAAWADAARRSSRPGPRPAGALRRARDRHHRRRVPRHLRRPGPGRPLRAGDRRRGPAAGPRGPGRAATPARSSSPATTCAAWPCTSAPGSPRSRAPARSWSRGPSGISSSARA